MGNELKLQIINADVLDGLAQLPNESVDCCITSPPYWGLRDYGNEGQLGLEKTPEEYVAKLVSVFREVKRVLKPKGTLWLNLGDSYMSSGYGQSENNDPKNNKTKGMNTRVIRKCEHCQKEYMGTKNQRFCSKQCAGFDNTPRIKKGVLKPKDLVGIPWRVAFALQADGWYLRQDIIWHKPSPMPESVTDRCTKAHEYIFLLTKSKKYYFDNEAIKESAVSGTYLGILGSVSEDNTNKVSGAKTKTVKDRIAQGIKPREGNQSGKRNKRSVWTVTTKPFKEAHFATFPEDLISPMVKAGCPLNGVVLDCFAGAGTTLKVARALGRSAVGVELKPQYCDIIKERLGFNIQRFNSDYEYEFKEAGKE